MSCYGLTVLYMDRVGKTRYAVARTYATSLRLSEELGVPRSVIVIFVQILAPEAMLSEQLRARRSHPSYLGTCSCMVLAAELGGGCQAGRGGWIRGRLQDRSSSRNYDLCISEDVL